MQLWRTTHFMSLSLLALSAFQLIGRDLISSSAAAPTLQPFSGEARMYDPLDRAHHRQRIYLSFSNKAYFSEVQARCTFQPAPGEAHLRHLQDRHVKVSLTDQKMPTLASSFQVIPQEDLSKDTPWTFSCSPALKSAEARQELSRFKSLFFRTHGPLKFIKVQPEEIKVTPERGTPIKLIFSNPLRPPYQVKLHPHVRNFPQQCYSLGRSPAGLYCTPRLKVQTHYKLTISGGQQDVYGQKLGEDVEVSFKTSDAPPSLSMDSGYYVAELLNPVLPIWTRNVTHLDFTALSITPDQFYQLRPLLDWWSNDPASFDKSPLTPTYKNVRIDSEKNRWRQHQIEPSYLLPVQKGPGMYYVEVASQEVKEHEKYRGNEKVLVNFTDIGLVTKLSPVRGLVWVTRLSTGAPLPNAQVSVRNDWGQETWVGQTDERGVVTLPSLRRLAKELKASKISKSGDSEGENTDAAPIRRYGMSVFVRSGRDWTLVNPFRNGSLHTSHFKVDTDYGQSPLKLRGFMHTDRGLYRPGETVYVKGLARESSLSEPLKVPHDRKVWFEIKNPKNKTLLERETTLSDFGGFWFDFKLPDDAPLGDYKMTARLKNGVFSHAFSVEEFRPSTFEVSGEVTGQLSHEALMKKISQHKADVSIDVNARYLYGAPVRGGDVNVIVHSRPRRVKFKHYKDFSFSDARKNRDYHSSYHAQKLITQEKRVLDDQGQAHLDLSISPTELRADSDLLMKVRVASPSNEVITKSFVTPFFRYQTYVGITSKRSFFELGEMQKFELVALNIKGERVDQRARVRVFQDQWNCVWEDWGYRGSYRCKNNQIEVLNQPLNLTKDQPSAFEFKLDQAGEYTIVVDEGPRASTESTKNQKKIKGVLERLSRILSMSDEESSEGSAEEQGKRAQPQPASPALLSTASRSFYIWGGGGSYRSDDSMTFDMIPDRASYHVGDEAIIVLKTDLAESRGLVTIERNGVIESWPIELNQDTQYIKIPIKAEYAPNVYVSLAIVQGRLGEGRRGKPKMKMGLVNLSVHPEDHQLFVSVDTDKESYLPGESVKATVKVVDAQQRPVSAEVALTAADEGVLSLINYKTPNPIPTFYAPWGIDVTTATQYAYLKEIPRPNLDRPATGGDSGALGTLRSRFMSTAVWRPGLLTNPQGVGEVTFNAPDQLTAFRVMAVAADRHHRFGSSERRFVVSQPLQLHRSLPRFLSIGDHFRGGVVVHNETGEAGEAVVRLSLDGSMKSDAPLEKRVSLKAGARVPVLFDLHSLKAGETTFTFSAQLGAHRDAVSFTLPIHTPAPIQTQALSSGHVEGKALSIPAPLPPHIDLNSAKLHVSLDAYGLAGIENGLRDLIQYPYGCLEQTTSKMIPMIAARGLAETLKIDGVAGEKLESFVRAGVTRLGTFQTSYGGFSLWRGGDAKPYYTAFALWGLYWAKEAGYTIDEDRLREGLNYLKTAQNKEVKSPYESEVGANGSLAFSLYIRALFGDRDVQAMSALNEKANRLPIYGQAFLAMAMSAGLGRDDPAVLRWVDTLNRLAQSASASPTRLIEEVNDLSWYMSDAVRTTSIVLYALVHIDPKSASIPSLVQALMHKHRTHTYLSTQANLYSLLALTDYAKTKALTSPSVKVKFGDEVVFSGPLKERYELIELVRPTQTDTQITIEPQGGEVFYNAQLSYRETPDSIKPKANTLALKREYLSEEGQPKTTFKVGDLVQVKLTMSAPKASTHLMISDHIPAGFEAVNTRLASEGGPGINHRKGESQRAEGDEDDLWEMDKWSSRSFMELHDDRVDFAHEYLSSGTHTKRYLIRAIAEGRFVLPPAVSELMYEPTKYARTALEYINIQPR